MDWVGGLKVVKQRFDVGGVTRGAGAQEPVDLRNPTWLLRFEWGSWYAVTAF